MSASAGEVARITLRVRGLLLDSASQALLELSASPASEVFRRGLASLRDRRSAVALMEIRRIGVLIVVM